MSNQGDTRSYGKRQRRVLAIIIISFVMLLAVLLGCGIAYGVNESESSQSTIEKSKNNNTFGMLERYLNEKFIDCNVRVDRALAVQKARGGVVIEANTRRVLADENMCAKCFPASTTKVLTALVVLEKMPLDTIVSVPKEAVGIEGSSIYLKEGEEITVEDLLLGLMLRSGNDAACTLAIAACGSIESFADAMNDAARKCGAVNSNFVNPHGLHDDNHYTTPYDLALITAKAYENEDFRRIVATRVAKISGVESSKHIGNKNKLLSMIEGANGVKTGYTKTSGRCLVGGAERDGMQLISVVLNYNDMWNDTIRLLEYGFANYEMVPLSQATTLRDGKAVHIALRDICTSDWQEVRYPLKKSGEYVVLGIN